MSWQREMRIKKLVKRRAIAMIEQGNCYCYLCGQLIAYSHDLNLDHIIPKCKGGKWLMPTHYWCNTKKGCMSIEDWVYLQYQIDIRSL